MTSTVSKTPANSVPIQPKKTLSAQLNAQTTEHVDNILNWYLQGRPSDIPSMNASTLKGTPMAPDRLTEQEKHNEFQKNLHQSIATKCNIFLQECQQKANEWLAQGPQGFVIGISGGIDSAVTSTLLAATGVYVRLVVMPIHQNEEETKRAWEHIEWLKSRFPNVESQILDLSDIYDASVKKLKKSGEDFSSPASMALANTRSRERMKMLYAIGNNNDLIVAGTGNKVEDYGVGFFTKYGDGGVDFSPIGGLTKSQVYDLARYQEIPQSIQDALPTDGLHSDGATDAEQIGCSYDELEWAMEQYDNGKRFTDFARGSHEQYVMFIYSRRHELNAHKMNMPPILNPFSQELFL